MDEWMGMLLLTEERQRRTRMHARRCALTAASRPQKRHWLTLASVFLILPIHICNLPILPSAEMCTPALPCLYPFSRALSQKPFHVSSASYPQLSLLTVLPQQPLLERSWPFCSPALDRCPMLCGQPQTLPEETTLSLLSSSQFLFPAGQVASELLCPGSALLSPLPQWC